MRGSAPRDPGASLALNERGEIAGSVTGGCVEPSVIREAQEVLDGGSARVREYGIADDEAFEVGLSCGGTVGILIAKLDTSLAARARRGRPRRQACCSDDDRDRSERSASSTCTTAPKGPVAQLLASGESALVDVDGEAVFVHSLAPRPAMHVFGAIDHAAALARVGKLLGYRVTVCDARAAFVTPERFPDADELVVEWPDRFLQRAPVDETTAICVLTHDQKFDVPALVAALETPAVLHRRDGQQGDDRRPRGAPARGGCRRRRHRPHPCSDRACDRRPLAGGGRGRDRRPDRRGDRRRTPPRRGGRVRCPF